MKDVPAPQATPDPEQTLEASHVAGVSRRAVLAGIGAASCLALEAYSLRGPGGKPGLSALSTVAIHSAAAAEAVSGAMTVQKDVPIPMMAGGSLLANIYRPSAGGKYPVMVAMSAYGKDVRPQDFGPQAVQEERERFPGFCRQGSSCRYMPWEAPDPEHWVPDGYVVVHVDARGAGRSPGYLDPFSAQETRDYYDAIEWAAAQPWSSGRVGLLGLSYYAMMQWLVAAMRPPHLAAIIPWEGASDWYRDATHQGGIPSNTFWHGQFWDNVVRREQYGNPDGMIDSATRQRTNGPLLNAQLLRGNRIDFFEQISAHYLDDEWMKSRSPILERIEVPLLSSGSWGGMGLHQRGNFEGYMRPSSKKKWLNMHVGLHFEEYYKPEGLALQKRFLDHFVKGVDNGWEREPRVKYVARSPHDASIRTAIDWPIPGTQWSRLYLDAKSRSLSRHPPGVQSSATYHALSSDGVSFTSAPFAEETEITGPLSAKLWVSSSTGDMDLFLTLQAFAPDGKEYVFAGSNDPAAPVTQGWLRVSQRKENPAKSLPGRPWHTHDESQKLTPGALYAVNVEIWPTNVVLPRGYRLTLVVEGKDFARRGSAGYKGMFATNVYRGSGPYLHTDRDPVQFGGISTVVTGPSQDSYLLLPIIPG
jgi:hypothetical protein